MAVATSLSIALTGLTGVGLAAEDGWNWVRHGFREAWALGVTDLEGDGNDEVVFGGRGIAAVDRHTAAKRRPHWSAKWDHDQSVLDGGDNEWAYELRTASATGDQVADAFVGSSDDDLYLMDGRTGQKRWYSPGAGAFFTFTDADSDTVPDLFTNRGITISGRTGEELRRVTLPGGSIRVANGQFDSGAGRDVVVGSSRVLADTNLLAFASSGEKLFEFKTVSAVTSVAAADVDGDGVDEAIAGTFNGLVFAVGSQGPRWVAPLGRGPVDALAVTDVDANGIDEVFAAMNDSAASSYQVAGLGPGGLPLWRHEVGTPIEVLQMEQLDADASQELLVGAGTDFIDNQGLALALEAGAVEATRERWRVPTARQVKSFALLREDGQRRVAIGSAEPLLRVVDAPTGQAAWNYLSGGYTTATAAGDVDGDSIDEIASGDDNGYLAMTSADGDGRWTARMQAGNDGHVMDVTIGDVDSDGGGEVVAVAQRLFESQQGVIELYEGDGRRRWSVVVPRRADDVDVADLDGDGRLEVIVGEASGSNGCRVSAFSSSDGSQLWVKDLPGCLIAHVDAGDTDGDGTPEIAYGSSVLFQQPYVALLEANGEQRWGFGTNEDTAWTYAVPGGAIFGGFATESRGHVTRRTSVNGDVAWQTILPADKDLGGASRFGIVVPDQDGDGTEEVLASSDAGDVHLLDGSTGARRWATRLEPPDLEFIQRHQAGPLAWIPGEQPMIAAAQYGIARKRSRTVLLTPSGEPVTTLQTEGDATSAAAARLTEQRQGAVVGAGLGLYAVIP